MSESGRKRRQMKAEALRQAEVDRARKRRNAVVAGAVAAVLIIVVVVGIAVQSNRGSTPSATSTATPSGLTEGGVLVGQAGAPVTVTLYEDFQCPVCRNFEEATGPTIDQLQAAGTVRVLDKPVAILDRVSPDQYSTRALNAVACLVDVDPAAFPAYKTALFGKQPEEGAKGLTDAELNTLAMQAGAPDVSACISSGRFEGWTQRTTDQASKDGLTGTPYVLVDGKQVSNPTTANVVAAVQAAQKG